MATMIEKNWSRLAEGLRAKGASDREVNNARLFYVGALYTAAAAINAEHIKAGDISEAAYRIELRSAG